MTIIANFTDGMTHCHTGGCRGPEDREASIMHVDALVAVAVAALVVTLFGRFETGVPIPRRVVRMGIYLVPALVIAFTVGPPWTYVWLAGALLPGACFHLVWCVRHGINPLTAEPRDRYLALRGWGPSER